MGLRCLSGAAAAAVIKLIPVYFPATVGAVSGLAKAAGAACGFTMTVTLAASKYLLGGYTFGFAIWALMNVAAFYIALSRVGFRHAKPNIETIPSGDATDAITYSPSRWVSASATAQSASSVPSISRTAPG